jgi:hypothetical protein
MLAFSCPRCGKSFEVDERLAGRRARCKQCGTVTRLPLTAETAPPVVFRQVASASQPASAPPREARRVKRKTIDRSAATSLAIGLVLACLALFIPPISFALHVLITVIHELGHTATSWLLGSPALPSFDLTHGGGVSYSMVPQPILILLIYAGFAVVAFRSRNNRATLFALLAVIIVYSVVCFSRLRDLLGSAMGHGAELLVAGIFLYRALSGSQILRGHERPLYAFLGLYIILADACFAYELMTNHERRQDYAAEKGGGHWMDFSRIADEHLHMSLQTVAALFLLACVLTPIVAFLGYRFKPRAG